jgi:hypothetical protein
VEEHAPAAPKYWAVKRRVLPLVLALAAMMPGIGRAAGSRHLVVIAGQRIPQGGSGTTSASYDFAGPWSHATIDFSDIPVCDPWDRLFSVDVDGVEILRGTTPRTAFTVRYDVTPYVRLLTGTHTVTVHLANYWEAQYSDCGTAPEDFVNQWHQVTVAFDVTPGAAPANAPSAFVVGWHLALLEDPGGDPGCADANPDGIDATTPVTIPAGPFTHATFYGYVTSHNCEEQWFLNPLPTQKGTALGTCAAGMLLACARRKTHVLVDGRQVAVWYPKPYTYAFQGEVGGETPIARLDGTPLAGTTEHQLQWWTVQKLENERGVYTGVGVIPPYAFDLTPFLRLLRTGTHTIEIRIDGGDSYWITSGELLLG